MRLAWEEVRGAMGKGGPHGGREGSGGGGDRQGSTDKAGGEAKEGVFEIIKSSHIIVIFLECKSI